MGWQLAEFFACPEPAHYAAKPARYSVKRKHVELEKGKVYDIMIMFVVTTSSTRESP